MSDKLDRLDRKKMLTSELIINIDEDGVEVLKDRFGLYSIESDGKGNYFINRSY